MLVLAGAGSKLSFFQKVFSASFLMICQKRSSGIFRSQRGKDPHDRKFASLIEPKTPKWWWSRFWFYIRYHFLCFRTVGKCCLSHCAPQLPLCETSRLAHSEGARCACSRKKREKAAKWHEKRLNPHQVSSCCEWQWCEARWGETKGFSVLLTRYLNAFALLLWAPQVEHLYSWYPPQKTDTKIM